MKNKEQKKQDVAALRELLQNSESIFVTGFEHLTVQQDFQLRKTVREAGGNYKVIKNTLAENASQGTPAEKALRALAGMTSLAYTTEDPVGLAKALTTYAKDNSTFTFKAGVVEGRVIDAAGIKALSAMPSRDDLFAKLLFLIQAPATGLARAIGGVGRNLAVVVGQGVQESKFSE
ncbi:MAG: 50S ribosomal protein L10 [bacterium]|nr:50S ribosomal protein L10 [bacterium]